MLTQGPVVLSLVIEIRTALEQHRQQSRYCRDPPFRIRDYDDPLTNTVPIIGSVEWANLIAEQVILELLKSASSG